jgi:hypothetical protein
MSRSVDPRHRVTIDDLVAGMGIVRPSLYSVFGPKRSNFFMSSMHTPRRRALSPRRHSCRRRLCASCSQAFCGTPSQVRPRKEAPQRCLLMCVAPLVNDPEVRQSLQNAAAATVALVERRSRCGISTGESHLTFRRRTREPGPRPCPRPDDACSDGHVA